MNRYLARRSLHSVITLGFIIVALFFGTHLLGDPVALILEDEYTDQQYEALMKRYGYDRPLHVQFVDYMSGVVRGDFGDSIRHHLPAMELVLDRLPKTFYLGGLAFALSLLGIPLGMVAGTHPRSLADKLINTSSFALMSAPGFWLALLGIFFFSVRLGLLPTSGFGGYAGWEYMVMPAVVLSVNSFARFAQFTRTAVMEELAKQYVVTAHSKGLSGRVVLWVHVMKNAGIAVATLGGDELSSVANGSVIMETVFGWPGVGYLMITAIQARDLPLVVAVVVVVAALVMVVNFTVDMLYAWLDPRIRYA